MFKIFHPFYKTHLKLLHQVVQILRRIKHHLLDLHDDALVHKDDAHRLLFRKDGELRGDAHDAACVEDHRPVELVDSGNEPTVSVIGVLGEGGH